MLPPGQIVLGICQDVFPYWPCARSVQGTVRNGRIRTETGVRGSGPAHPGRFTCEDHGNDTMRGQGEYNHTKPAQDGKNKSCTGEVVSWILGTKEPARVALSLGRLG
jgi:hypothetical protein